MNTLKKTQYIPDFNSMNTKSILELHSRFLPHSARFREETMKILHLEYEKWADVTRFVVDGSKFSSNIHILNESDYDFQNHLLKPWIDWVISSTKQKVQLILPVADCTAISAFNKSWEIHWLFHAWTKSVAWKDDLWMIYNMISSLKYSSKTDNLDDFKFYISPMLGLNFELERDYVDDLFKNIFEVFNLKSDKYYNTHKTDNSKIYLDLKTMIIDIMVINWIKKNNIFNKWNWRKWVWNVTNSPYSNFPSFRLHTIAKKLKEKIIDADFKLVDDKDIFYWIENLTLQEKELLESGKLVNYLTDYRLALELRNYF